MPKSGLNFSYPIKWVFFVLPLLVFPLWTHSQSSSLWDRCRSVFAGSSKPALQKFLKANSYDQRQKFLKDLDDSQFSSLLRQITAHPLDLDENQKIQIIRHVGEHYYSNDPEAVLNPLLRILESRFEDINVREASIKALGKILKRQMRVNAQRELEANAQGGGTKAQGATGSNRAPAAAQAQGATGSNLSPAGIKAVRRMAEFLSQSDQNIYFLKQKIAETLNEIRPKDHKTLYLLSQALWTHLGRTTQGQQGYLISMRQAIYEILEGPLSAKQTSAEGPNSVERREPHEGMKRPAVHLTGRVRKKILHNLAQTLGSGYFTLEEKKTLLDLLKKAKPRDILTVQWMGRGLEDPNPEVVIATANALGAILKTKLPADRFAVRMARGLIPKGLMLFDTVLDLKLHVAFKLTRTLSLWNRNNKIKKELIQALISINAWYPGVSFEVMNSLSDSYPHSYLLGSEDPEMIKEMMGFFESTFSKRNRLKLLVALLPFYRIVPKEFRPSQRKKQLASLLGTLSFDQSDEIRKIAYDSLTNLPVSPRDLYPLQSDYARWFERNRSSYKQSRGKKRTIYREGRLVRPSYLKYLPEPFDSGFELDMFLKINKRGYVVFPQFTAPFSTEKPYRVDFLVVDAWDPNKHLVVECDGPHHNEPRQRAIDKQRQKEWTNQGFRFFRIAAEQDPSQPERPYFYEPTRGDNETSDPLPAWPHRKIHEPSLERLWNLLRMNGIRPAPDLRL